MTLIINKDFVSSVNTGAGAAKRYIVIHETDNYAPGAGAHKHAYAQCMGHLADMSVHYYVDDVSVYQAAPLDRSCWSIGREYGGDHSVHDASNANTINIEICVNPESNYEEARGRAIELVKYLIKATNIPAERVIRHFDAKGKYCPRKMMDDPSLWEDFKRKIASKSEEDTRVDITVKKTVISLGSKCEDVRQLQILLNGYGYPDDDGNALDVDGSAGTKTISALIRYQRYCGLEVDGICGPGTWTNLLR